MSNWDKRHWPSDYEHRARCGMDLLSKRVESGWTPLLARKWEEVTCLECARGMGATPPQSPKQAQETGIKDARREQGQEDGGGDTS